MRTKFHRKANIEFAEAAVWYERQRPGLGSEFRKVVREAALLIAENPQAWPPWPGLADIRNYTLRRFPFLLPYTIEAQHVVILAVAHAKRRPGYWAGRLSPQ